MRRLIVLICLLMLTAAQAESTGYYGRGDQVADFSLVTWDGEEITLSAAMAGKEAVVLHFFTLRCGGCEEEMPLLQSAWEAYGEQVAFIAVTIDAADTDKQLKTYCTRRGLTFPVARDTAELAFQYPVYGVPMTLVIDKTGVLREIKEGALADLAAFEQLVGPWLAAEDEYLAE